MNVCYPTFGSTEVVAESGSSVTQINASMSFKNKHESLKELSRVLDEVILQS